MRGKIQRPRKQLLDNGLLQNAIRQCKQEVSLKKIIVEGYRAVGTLNTKTIDFSHRTFCCCSLLISVNGETNKSAIKRPIKIRTHHVVWKHLTTTVTDKK